MRANDFLHSVYLDRKGQIFHYKGNHLNCCKIGSSPLHTLNLDYARNLVSTKPFGVFLYLFFLAGLQ